jgi:ADP-ribosylglycohydrolase
VDYNYRKVKGMPKKPSGAFVLQPGQWTDDASMGIAVAESLLSTGGQLDCLDLMLRFLCWWHMGYCNAFAHDAERSPSHSVGLGGNISAAMRTFLFKGEPSTSAGNKKTSGIGSIMRLSAIPVAFHDRPAAALTAARAHSLTTHQGEEAAECCRLMAKIIVELINYTGDHPKTDVLQHCAKGFESPEYSVMCLARSEPELDPATKEPLPDRDWSWQTPGFRYSPTRAKQQPGYVGSYAMDGLAMALHCVWTTETFEAALLKSANLCGDADSVSAVVGQIAGAMYGTEALPQSWVDAVQRWDGGGLIAYRAWRLFHGDYVSEEVDRSAE